MKNIVISIAVYDTESNDRTKYTKATFNSLMQTVDFKTTDIVFINNASCKETTDFLNSIIGNGIYVIHNTENLGTAEAVNRGWKMFEHYDYKIKCDNDITFGEFGWADKMTTCFEKFPELGILGLKRKDLPNEPLSEGTPTDMFYLSHELGDKWDFYNVIEVCDDIIGSCVMINSNVFTKCGYLWQPAEYAFDDTLMCHRSILAGFINAFYPCIEIEHIDEGNTDFTQWKRDQAGIYLSQIEGIVNDYKTGKSSIYYNPFS